ncbi:MAG TPA: hypothetical protein PLM13_10905 [Anaerolineales bacterium]|nr:hypothetical protein [Anaerolineales bacterium]
MIYRHFKHETWLYVLVLLIAVSVRTIQLGAMPLSDSEAAPALQALQITQGQRPLLSPHPFYILSTAVLFFLYGEGTNFLARFSPALIGSLLVLIPLLFTERIKPRPGLILALFIALDPGMVALSRQAASPIFAITFLLFAIGFYENNNLKLAGIFAALALLGGPSIWLGLLSIGIAWAIYRGVQLRGSEEQASVNVKEALWPFVVTLVVAGTFFFLIPNGLSAAFSSIPEFFKRWTIASDFPASRFLIALAVYQPLGILLAVIALIRGWQHGSRRIISLSLWFIVALLLAIFIPSREIADISWALIPLWGLAALELIRNLHIFPEERNEIFGVVFLTAFIWVFAWLDFSGMVWLPNTTREYMMRFWLLVGALLLIAISLLLVAAGWSIRTARIGGVLGMALVLGALGLGGTFGAAGLRGLDNPEIWWQAPLPVQAQLIQASVNDLSEWGTGNDNMAPVIIAGLDSPALEWALREHQVEVVETLDISSAPYFVITPLQNDPAFASTYRGQDFTWRKTFLWNETLPQDWIRWVTLREVPQTGESIILWARDDLFLDKANQSIP